MDRLLGFSSYFSGCLIAVLLLLSSAVYSAENRTALVIGNAAYQGLSPLDNPANDAKDMAAKLRQLGFEVIHEQDARYQAMDAAVNQFGRRLKARGGVGLFFYAGHGVQVNGSNYLIPVDARLREQYQVKHQTLSADLVLDIMGNAGNSMNIVILDACRDNPFVSASRSLRRGLAQMNAPTGSLIAYATGKGNVADDGEGRNGVYTGSLLKHIDQPNLSLEQVFKRVRAEVRTVTAGRQTPWEEGSLIGDFYFIDQVIIEPVKPNNELAYWNSIKDEQEPAYFRAYINQYGAQGVFTSLAKIRLARLERQPQPTPVTPTEPVLKRRSFEPEMVQIRGGTFNMGSPDSEKERFSNERLHTVQVADFWIGKTEVTFAQYDVFAEKTGRDKPGDRGWGRGNHPVINVSWHDAVAYAEWLSREAGKPYRLPTEAEWEYAARAGTSTPFSFGANIRPEQVNYDGNYPYNGGKKGLYRGQTVVVQSLPANRWGLYEMHGNVREWTCSGYDQAYSGGEQRCISSDAGDYRVLRGGSWIYYARYARSAYRHFGDPSYRHDRIGFRLARGPKK